ncbi:lysophospholipase L1-like esterase [Dyadobacter jejuensis]|uniref:Lysophospholipase L1-like esterase n=1 Tax=Dyadobacter jejuensis TaxID=1082580 RepID=A0A316AHX2_9BACT|nr:GDSL-type esterase/lipase family protein [Dyadobacter jejuensis]PWJ57241.1 lysophospholipase L1-like esterase [Dyadobacter jejuensis]
MYYNIIKGSKFTRITVFLLLATFLGSCHKPSYTSLAADWTPDYDLDRFEKTILSYEKRDAVRMPPKGGIVFTGSSSFTKWTKVDQDLAPLPIINRGFGGSTIPEVIHYADRTIFKYQPKTVVIYCENDMFGAKAKTPVQVRDEYVKLTKMIHENLPGAKIYGISLKPSPSRWSKKEESLEANRLIKDFIAKDKGHEYIDIWDVMLKDGRPDGAIFVSDSLHMNQEGYDRWVKVLRPILEKAPFDAQ